MQLDEINTSAGNDKVDEIAENTDPSKALKNMSMICQNCVANYSFMATSCCAHSSQQGN